MQQGFSPEKMEARFLEVVKSIPLFGTDDLLLLAVSGGLDSVVLCELCHRAGFSFIIAHVNFRLRAAESDRDEAFVRQLADRYGVPFQVTAFDTAAYAAQKKCSIQEAARTLRYAWFAQLQAAYETARPPGTPGRVLLLTAHHAGDSIETLLMNFFKGTGITGLQGILPKQGSLLRPLLPFWKSGLQDYAKSRQLTWVEDSSNESVKYSRNFIRHEILPRLAEKYPQIEENLLQNIGRFREAGLLYQESVDRYSRKLLQYDGEEMRIPVLRLRQLPARRTLLLEWLKPYGFSPRQLPDIEALLGSDSGKYQASATHRIIRHRNWLIVAPLAGPQASHILIEGPGTYAYPQGELDLQQQPAGEVLLTDARVAQLDAGAIRFPLLLRPWKAGDYFYPLGMKKKKKLARFLIDRKLSRTEKEKIWVLEMDRKIVWVVGLRIDDRFAIRPGSSTQWLITTR